MQFSVIVLLAAFAASASAIPTGVRNYARSCDAATCAAALGPTAVSCVSAAVQEGIDPISDAGCLASGVNTATNPPAGCDGCASGVGSAVSGALGTAESAISSIF